MYRKFLGENYDGTPLRAPADQSSGKEIPQESTPTTPQTSVSNVPEDDNGTKGQGKVQSDGHTQVQEFMRTIKSIKTRESRSSSEQIPQNESPPDMEYEQRKDTNGECVSNVCLCSALPRYR